MLHRPLSHYVTLALPLQKLQNITMEIIVQITCHMDIHSANKIFALNNYQLPF